MMIFFTKKREFKRIKKAICVFVFIIFSMVSLAQQAKVSGTITDKKLNSTLPGVSILIKGTAIGSSSNFNGKYSIKASINDVLVFSYLGYKT
jgi:iron complex outermembrane receptor protein